MRPWHMPAGPSPSENGGEHLAEASAVGRWRRRDRVHLPTVLTGAVKGMVALEEDLPSELPFRP